MSKNIIISNIKGGLGNQLFQYATGLSLALKNKAEFKLDLAFFDDPKFKTTWRLDSYQIPLNIASEEEISLLKNCHPPLPFYARVLSKLGINNKFRKHTHLYDTSGHKPSEVILNAKSPAYLEGWCVKDIYFSDIRTELFKIFTPKIFISENSKKILEQIESTVSVSLHIRRGDYLTNDFFKTLELDYYTRAISTINAKIDNPVFFVFSNDIVWAKENFGDLKNFIIIDFNAEIESEFNTKGDVEDMLLMQKCKNNIIANSSFSWWPAWLNENENKIVIYPAIWYGNAEAQQNYETYPFMPEDWIKI